MKPLVFFTTLLLCCCNLCNSFAQPAPFGVSADYEKVALAPNELPNFESYRAHPQKIDVLPIAPKDLAATLNNCRRPCYILDARSEKEFQISHIDKARLVGFEDFSAERVWMLDRAAHVVVYSANQERGLLLAQYLQLMGFTDVQLLDGGLIGWKNTGHTIVDAEGKTERVHVGKKSNLRLLKSGLAVQ